MKRGNLLAVIANIVIIIAFLLAGSDGARGMILLIGLYLNDLFAMYVVKYGEVKMSRLLGDTFKYFFLVTFDLAFLFVFFMAMFKATSYVNSNNTFIALFGGISVIMLFYYMPSYLSVGRLVMYRNYERKGLGEGGKKALEEALAFSISKSYIIILVIFYMGAFLAGKLGNILGSTWSDLIMTVFLLVIYGTLPVIAEKMYDEWRKNHKPRKRRLAKWLKRKINK